MIDTTHFKQKLEEERALLETQLKTVARKNPANPADWELKGADIGVMGADPMDEASAYEVEEENANILNELEVRLEQVTNALARIEEGTYGLCKVSGEEIETERLEANPAADTCMEHLTN